MSEWEQAREAVLFRADLGQEDMELLIDPLARGQAASTDRARIISRYSSTMMDFRVALGALHRIHQITNQMPVPLTFEQQVRVSDLAREALAALHELGSQP